jgi:predicted RNA polymerase sigma factor
LRAFGAEQGLEIMDRLPAMPGYVQLPAVRGDLLAKLGRPREARGQFLEAAALTSDERERELYRARAEECAN